MYGGNDESKAEFVFENCRNKSSSGFSIDGIPPICIPISCHFPEDNQTQISLNNFHVMKLWTQQVYSLTLIDMSVSLFSVQPPGKMSYERTISPVPIYQTPVDFSALLVEGGIAIASIISVVILVTMSHAKEIYKNNAQQQNRHDPTLSTSLAEQESSKYQSLISSTDIPADQIRIGDILGRGTFGAVYRGDYLGKPVAIKVLFAQDQNLVEFKHEVSVLSNLHHPNIVQFIGTSYPDNYGACALTEFMASGDLRAVLQKSSAKEIDLRWLNKTSFSKVSIAIDVISGLVYLHSLSTPVIHRDMKSRNILLSNHYVAKIADFGVSRVISNTSTMTGVGSHLWVAPEVLLGERYDEKSDIYSFGVILTELDTEQLPFYDAYSDATDEYGNRMKLNSAALMYHVTNLGLRPSLTPTCNPTIISMAESCMDSDPLKRPSAAQVLNTLSSICQDN